MGLSGNGYTLGSGYCSEKNLKYLKDNNIESYIKLQEHEKKKTRKYYQQIGKYYNMEKVEGFNSTGSKEIYYKCHDGRKLLQVFKKCPEIHFKLKASL